jgi:hypothetical protein
LRLRSDALHRPSWRYDCGMDLTNLGIPSFQPGQEDKSVRVR